MPKPSHRDALVEAGLQTMFRKGYVGATVREIANAAEAPQGSFTNHFRSKEQFALEVLDTYFEHIRSLMALADEAPSPRAKIERYLDLITDRLMGDDFARGCLIGDLSIEAPGHSESIRVRLRDIYRDWTEMFTEWIAAAQRTGEITSAFDAHDLADLLITGWEGAILRTKVERSRDPLDRFRAVALRSLLGAEARQARTSTNRTRRS
jgi:TetR/AcrR family transcriptional repressor of nem operon